MQIIITAWMRQFHARSAQAPIGMYGCGPTEEEAIADLHRMMQHEKEEAEFRAREEQRPNGSCTENEDE